MEKCAFPIPLFYFAPCECTSGKVFYEAHTQTLSSCTISNELVFHLSTVYRDNGDSLSTQFPEAFVNHVQPSWKIRNPSMQQPLNRMLAQVYHQWWVLDNNQKFVWMTRNWEWRATKIAVFVAWIHAVIGSRSPRRHPLAPFHRYHPNIILWTLFKRDANTQYYLNYHKFRWQNVCGCAHTRHIKYGYVAKKTVWIPCSAIKTSAVSFIVGSVWTLLNEKSR